MLEWFAQPSCRWEVSPAVLSWWLCSYYASVCASEVTIPIVERILDNPPSLSTYLEDAVLTLSTSAAQPDWSRLENIDVPLRQCHLSCATDEAVFQTLLSTAPTTRAKALTNSTALPHAGDWLNGVPSDTLGLHIQDREFRCCLRYWLGIPLHNSPHCCPACHTIAVVTRPSFQ